MDDYISKPIRAPLLYNKLADICDLPPADGSSAAEPSPAPATEETFEVPIDDDVVDWDSAMDVVGGDRELLGEILEAILEECPQQFASLEKAIAEQDSGTARRAAHTILGNMRAISANEAMDKASVVELLARDSEFDAMPEPVEALREATDSVYRAVQQFQAK